MLQRGSHGSSERFNCFQEPAWSRIVLPKEGKIFLSVISHKAIIKDPQRLHDMDYSLMATEGTAASIEEAGIPVQRVKKIAEGPLPDRPSY